MRHIRSSFARSTLALLLTAGLVAAAVPAGAEELAAPSFKVPDGKAAAKPAAKSKAKEGAKAASKSGVVRRPGELEGWDKEWKPAPGKSNRPLDAVGERKVPDGGLPLPSPTLSNDPNGPPPIGFDKNGNMGGAFRF